MTYRTSAEAPDVSGGETFQEVLERRMARRSFLKSALIAAPLVIAGPDALGRFAEASGRGDLHFKPIVLDNQDRVLVAEDYEAKALIR